MFAVCIVGFAGDLFQSYAMGGKPRVYDTKEEACNECDYLLTLHPEKTFVVLYKSKSIYAVGRLAY